MEIEYSVQTFESLTKEDLYNLLRFRQEVFVVEQSSAYLDADGIDLIGFQIIGKSNGDIVSTARIFKKEYNGRQIAYLGRFALSSDFRGRHYGKELLELAIELCREKYPGLEMGGTAQVALLGYYSQFGFEPEGEEFDDGGIPHRMVIKND